MYLYNKDKYVGISKRINGICHKDTVWVHTEKVDGSWFFKNLAIDRDIKSGKL